MSEKATIPTEMLDAATRALYEKDGHDYAEKDRSLERGYWQRFQGQAEATLRAAGVPELVARIAELEAALALAIPRMEHLQSLLSCGESVQFCNEFDEQEGKDVAEEVERLKRIMQNAPTGAGGE